MPLSRVSNFALLAAALIAGAGAACSEEELDPRSVRPGADGADGGTTSTASAPAPFPLARLTRSQYERTLRDLFAPIALPAGLSPPADVSVEGFDADTMTQTPSPSLIEAYQAAAVGAATAALTQAATFLGCAPTGRAEEDACATSFVDRFAARAFRRPLTDDDRTRLAGVYAAARTDGSPFAEAMALVVQSVLQSPYFLYRIEAGVPVAGNPSHRALTSHEMASRLSYALWDTMPDDALFAAAREDALSGADGVEKQARRMLANPRAKDAVANFHRQWLKLDAIDKVTKDATLFPAFRPTTAAAMRRAVDKRVETAFFGDGNLRALLTGLQAWVNDELAPFYGVPAPGSSELSLVPLDKTKRAGLLTDVGILSALAHPSSDAPILRGVFVLDRMLCAPPPAAPPNVPSAPANDQAHPTTLRDRLEQQHAQGSCASCHKSIDAVGFAFGHYDAAGQYRDTESGLPVNATGKFVNVAAEGSFDGAVELSQKLAESRAVQSCLASNWMRYTLGVDRRGLDQASVDALTQTFVDRGLDMRELVVALVKSDAFRLRLVGP